ncbi:MAG: hypothetical protein ACRDQB_14775 [Thermocrispum sp.]
MPIINHDGGSMDMNTELTQNQMRAVKASSDAYRAAWGGAKSSIQSLAANLGKPHTGQEFKAKYDAPADQIWPIAEKLQGIMAALADGGTKTVSEYLAQDGYSRDEIMRLLG